MKSFKTGIFLTILLFSVQAYAMRLTIDNTCTDQGSTGKTGCMKSLINANGTVNPHELYFPSKVIAGTPYTVMTAIAIPSNYSVTVDPGAYFSGAAVTAGTITGIKNPTPEMFGLNTNPGTTDMTTAIQAAHNCSAGGDFSEVYFSGRYKFTTLTWSPHVGARTKGKTYLETANASGRTIQISDQYGRPALWGLGSMRNMIFDGQFYLKNTNAANAAIAWSFGGLTTSYYCCIASMRGVETRNFHGGVYEILNNAFNLDFYAMIDVYCNGPRLIARDPITNSIGMTNFYGTAFGSSTNYVFDINTVHGGVFNFYGCYADPSPGINTPGNSSPLIKVNWYGGAWEWTASVNAFLQNDNGMDFTGDGIYMNTSMTVGGHDPFVSETTGAGTTRMVNCLYAFGYVVPTLHKLVSATSKGVFDYSPNCLVAPADNVSYASDSVVGYTGITYRTLSTPSYVPTWSGTIGNGTLAGRYTRIGNRVDVTIKLIWGSTTSHGAATQTFDLPFPNGATYAAVGSWWADDYGTGAKVGIAKIEPSGTLLALWDSAAAAQVTNAVPMTWAVNDKLYISITYFVD